MLGRFLFLIFDIYFPDSFLTVSEFGDILSIQSNACKVVGNCNLSKLASGLAFSLFIIFISDVLCFSRYVARLFLPYKLTISFTGMFCTIVRFFRAISQIYINI